MKVYQNFLETNNLKCQLHALTVMVISHTLCSGGERSVSPEISERCLQDRYIYVFLSYPLHHYALPFSRFTDLYCIETGLMTRSMTRKYIHQPPVFIRILIK